MQHTKFHANPPRIQGDILNTCPQNGKNHHFSTTNFSEIQDTLSATCKLAMAMIKLSHTIPIGHVHRAS